MHDVMIDIETLGVKTHSPCFQIGMVKYEQDTFKIIADKRIDIDLFDVIVRTGFIPDPKTVEWWQTQYRPEHRNAFIADMVTLPEALNSVDVFINGIDGDVWANSPHFDLGILEAHYEALGRDWPWSFRQERDVRTLRKLCLRLGYSPFDPPATHGALEDAHRQTNMVQDMMYFLESLERPE